MKNVTISLPEEVLEALRDRARAQKMSLNAWLRDLLVLEANQTDPSESFGTFADRVAESTKSYTWRREDAYEERLR